MSPCIGSSPPAALVDNTTTPDRLYYEQSQNPEKASAKTKQTDIEKKKRIQHCQRCENHGDRARKSRHECPYRDCQCNECQLTSNCQLMMKHQQRFWRWRKQIDAKAAIDYGEEKIPSGAQRCDRCRNHGLISLKKGHKGNCEYQSCNCEMCTFISKRQEYLKHNQRLKRKRSSNHQTVAEEEKILPEVKKENRLISAPFDVNDKQRVENYHREFQLAPPLLSRSLSSMSLKEIEFEERKNMQSVLLREPGLWPLVPQPLKPTPIIPNPTYFFSPLSPYPPYQYMWLRKF